MKDLQEATEKICELKGENMALLAVVDALLRSMPQDQLDRFIAAHTEASEVGRVTLLNSDRVGESVVSSFDRHTQNFANLARSI
ncbi:hypothetical protein LGN20_07265 [Burkholderia cepacia]|uniref:hypothetical protein n=1 Tax=Burkholderia cepacia TaxID=292 RepID=UPI001CF1CEAB|nr:hypothetical protein [Burkholderia cepacia]MCA8213701.1 hypothetical protein [Burkholderia cepacia]